MTDDPPTAIEERFDCIVISDIHLGSAVCQAKLLEGFLEWAVSRTRELVINGDIFDDLNFKRLNKRHFACLRVIRRNSDREGLTLTWIRGNHDGAADVVSHIVGVEFRDEAIFDNGRVRLLILHGDQFDYFITKYRLLTSVGCGIFYYIQKWMPHRASRWIRRNSKRFQRNSRVVRDGAVSYAKSKQCTHVTCGHTHLALESTSEGIGYLNSGTWTEHPPCPFVAVAGDRVTLEYWPRGEAESDRSVAQEPAEARSE